MGKAGWEQGGSGHGRVLAQELRWRSPRQVSSLNPLPGLSWHSKEGPFKLVRAAILGLVNDPEASPKPHPHPKGAQILFRAYTLLPRRHPPAPIQLTRSGSSVLPGPYLTSRSHQHPPLLGCSFHTFFSPFNYSSSPTLRTRLMVWLLDQKERQQ